MPSFFQSYITPIATTSTLISNIVFIGFVVIMLFDKKVRDSIYRFVYRYILELIAGASLAALLGSLIYSQIVGFPPCELCWIQRIFMYPQTFLACIALRWKDKKIVDYLLPLSIIGALVAFYHSLVQWGFSLGIGGCVAVGGECAKVFVLSYGYITIPFMSFTVFAYLIGFSCVYYLARRKIEGREAK